MSTAPALVAGLAALALLLSVRGGPGPGRVVRADVLASHRPRLRGRAVTAVLPWGGAGLLWCAGAGTVGAVTAGVVLAAVLRGRRRAHEAAARSVREELAFEACGVLVDELRAGRTPQQALDAAGEVDPSLAPALRTAGAGGDVPGALRSTGARSYRWVAATWQVADDHGSGLGESLRRVMAQVRADRSTARTVASELASARATAKLLAALPLFALLAATASGSDPWTFLLHTPLGSGCLVLGLLLGWAGLRWIEAIADGVEARA